jgi:hypothetical protein
MNACRPQLRRYRATRAEGILPSRHDEEIQAQLDIMYGDDIPAEPATDEPTSPRKDSEQ